MKDCDRPCSLLPVWQSLAPVYQIARCDIPRRRPVEPVSAERGLSFIKFTARLPTLLPFFTCDQVGTTSSHRQCTRTHCRQPLTWYRQASLPKTTSSMPTTWTKFNFVMYPTQQLPELLVLQIHHSTCNFGCNLPLKYTVCVHGKYYIHVLLDSMLTIRYHNLTRSMHT